MKKHRYIYDIECLRCEGKGTILKAGIGAICCPSCDGTGRITKEAVDIPEETPKDDEQELICPLRMMIGHRSIVTGPTLRYQCLKEKCAWWQLAISVDAEYKDAECAVSRMARSTWFSCV